MQGNGTKESPYLISTPDDLNEMRNHLTSHFKLINDIDMSRYEWTTIGSSSTTGWDGVLEGNGKRIFNLKTINSRYQALIGWSNSGIIKNLGLVDINMQGTASNGRIGGIVGVLHSDAVIKNCYSTGTISGTGSWAGGIVAASYGTVENCYSMVNLNSTASSKGGVVGYIYGNSIWRNNYCASKGAGFYGAIGQSGQIYDNNYFDSTIGSGSSISGIEGRSTQQLKTRSTYPSTWDFEEIWQLNDGEYPTLQIFNPLGNHKTVEVDSFTKPFVHQFSIARRVVKVSLISSQPISQDAHIEALVIAKSMLKEIGTDALAYKNANIKTAKISSYFGEISNESLTRVRATKVVNSELHPFKLVIDTIIPNEVEKPIYANVYVKANQSASQYLTNQTYTSSKQNMTETSVI